MENIIQKLISSQSVQRMAKAKRMKDREVWSLFFDTGLDYLSQLRYRITHYNVFKAQFGDLMSDFQLKITPDEAFRQILASPDFWNWWSSQFWRVCYNYGNDCETELRIRLMHNNSLIPQSTLEKIFINETRLKKSEKRTGMSTSINHRTKQVC